MNNNKEKNIFSRMQTLIKGSSIYIKKSIFEALKDWREEVWEDVKNPENRKIFTLEEKENIKNYKKFWKDYYILSIYQLLWKPTRRKKGKEINEQNNFTIFNEIMDKYSISKYQNLSFGEFNKLQDIDLHGIEIDPYEIELLSPLEKVKSANLTHMGLNKIPQIIKNNTKLKKIGLFFNNIGYPSIRHFQMKHPNTEVY